jgi:hypothetical protein
VTRDEKIIAAAAAGAVLFWWFAGDDEESGVLGDIRQAVNSAVNLVVKGARLTHAPYDTTTGVVPADPQALADQSGYDLETYALARAIASEEGRSSDFVKLCTGWAIRNRANASSGSILTLVTRAKYAPHSGYFGTQRNIEAGTPGYNGSDRYCSTANDPYDGDAQIAYAIQTGTLPDPTGGAQYFDRPAHDDNAAQTAANRLASNLEIAQIDGLPDSIRFWRPIG